MRKIRWGIVSTANIGVAKVVPAMMRGTHSEVVAIASRDLAKAQAAASKLGIAKAYGSYEALLADPEVEAIYNPLPNHLHVPVSIQALQAGKHVLCEKPIALSAAEAQQLVDAGQRYPQLKLMEAFMYRHHPQWQRAKAIVASGGIGQLRTINSVFSYFLTDPSNVRNQADIGGGGLMDIGCYNISLSRFIFGSEPTRVCGLVEYDPTLNVDRLASGMMQFAGGTATFTCSTQLSSYQRVNIFGTTGRIEIEIPFNAPPDKPCKMWHTRSGTTQEIVFPVCDQYTIQGDLFSLAILNDTAVPTPMSDAVANMRVIEAIVASDKQGGWVRL
ncbi:MAG: Gfo/Idh/MocA family protein [Roseiflexaceae bacterium]|jgi:predicted dehydrogenase|nr:Gfo/Idh/MocA family oxidoreductase [Chloroflexaceae bacterium]